MKKYKLTTRGKVVLALIGIIALLSIIKGGLVLAYFILIFFTIMLVLSVYEIFINR